MAHTLPPPVSPEGAQKVPEVANILVPHDDHEHARARPLWTRAEFPDVPALISRRPDRHRPPHSLRGCALTTGLVFSAPGLLTALWVDTVSALPVAAWPPVDLPYRTPQ